MKNVAVYLSLLLMTVGLFGCTRSKENTEVKDEQAVRFSNSTAKKGIVVEGLKISFSDAEILSKVETGKNKKDVYVFTVKGENVSGAVKGLGSIDFQLKTADGEVHAVDSSFAVFGDEIKPGEDISGTIAFSVMPNQKVTSVAYTPADKELMEWKVE